MVHVRGFQPLETGIHVLHAVREHAHAQGQGEVIDRPEWLANLSGTDDLLRMLKDGKEPQAIIAAWRDVAEAFMKRRKPYLLYD